MPDVVQLRGGGSYNFNFNAGVVRFGYSGATNAIGPGNIGGSVTVGVGIWEGRASVDATGNYGVIAECLRRRTLSEATPF